MPMNKIKLRAIEPEDLELLYKIENDVRLWNVGATNVPYSKYTLHELTIVEPHIHLCLRMVMRHYYQFFLQHKDPQ